MVKGRAKKKVAMPSYQKKKATTATAARRKLKAGSKGTIKEGTKGKGQAKSKVVLYEVIAAKVVIRQGVEFDSEKLGTMRTGEIFAVGQRVAHEGTMRLKLDARDGWTSLTSKKDPSKHLVNAVSGAGSSTGSSVKAKSQEIERLKDKHTMPSPSSFSKWQPVLVRVTLPRHVLRF